MRAGRRTQVVKGAVCKTAMQRFDPARRLHTALARPGLSKDMCRDMPVSVPAQTWLTIDSSRKDMSEFIGIGN